MTLLDPTFWKGRRVLLSGHTGFKGSWAALWLSRLGASVTGIALEPEGTPSLFNEAGIDEHLDHHVVDIRDPLAMREVVSNAKPEIVLHMAAQSLVRRSYLDPVGTFLTNAQGTVNLLDALRDCESVKVVLAVTTDKVYENDDKGRAFREEDRLGGHDPYSASKAAAEIAVACYARSFFTAKGVRVATVRGGNVIGGGDFSEDRIVPDIWRAIGKGEAVVLRNPGSVRPWQHALDCLHGYLVYIQGLATDASVPDALNIGPDEQDPVTVKDLTETFFAAAGLSANIHYDDSEQPVEKALLSLDPRRAHEALGWRDLLTTAEAVDWTAQWYGGYSRGEDAKALLFRQIDEFMARS